MNLRLTEEEREFLEGVLTDARYSTVKAMAFGAEKNSVIEEIHKGNIVHCDNLLKKLNDIN